MKLVVSDLNVHSEILKNTGEWRIHSVCDGYPYCLDTDNSLLWSNGVLSTFALGKSPSSQRHVDDALVPALLRLQWQRRSPGLLTRHTLDADFSPVSVMYNDQALTGLVEFFQLSDEDNRDEHDADMAAATAEMQREEEGMFAHSHVLEHFVRICQFGWSGDNKYN